MTADPEEPWYTKRELAAELKVSVRTVERMKLPAQPVGAGTKRKQKRYRMSEVLAAMNGVEVDDGSNVVPIRPTTKGAA